MICGVMYERSRSKPSFWKRRFFLETTPRRLFIVKTEPSHGSAAPARRSRSVCGSEASSAGTEAEACRWSAISALTASSSAESRSAAACSARASCSSLAAASRCACASAPRVMASEAAATSLSASRSARESPYGSAAILQKSCELAEDAPKSKDTWRLTSWQVDATAAAVCRVHQHGPYALINQHPPAFVWCTCPKQEHSATKRSLPLARIVLDLAASHRRWA